VADLLVVAVMLLSALAPFALATFWMQRGMVGYTLTLIALIGAGLLVAGWGASRPIGLDPVSAMGAVLLVFAPAICGCGAGTLLGWLIYRRRFT